MDDKPTSRAACGHSVQTLYDLMSSELKRIEAVGTERDKRYTEKFDAQEKAVAVSFAASERAIAKSERSQELYNEKSNEFRGALSDQATRLITRPEHDRLAEEISMVQVSLSKFITRGEYDGLALQMKALQITEGKVEGGGRGTKDAWGNLNTLILAAAAIALVVVELLKR